MPEDEEILKAFGNTVRKYRYARNWSQERLADECQLDRTYVSGVERGERNLGLLNVIRLANALEIRAGDLLDFHSPN